MKSKIIISFAIAILLSAGVYLFFLLKNGDETTSEQSELSFTEFSVIDYAVYTTLEIPKGDYEAGDLIYLTYYEEEQSSFNFGIPKVYALEDQDVIGYYELTQSDVDVLKSEDRQVKIETALTDDELSAIGEGNLQKHVRMQKLQNKNAETKQMIQNKYQEKEQEYNQIMQSKKQSGSNGSNNSNGTNNSNENGNN